MACSSRLAHVRSVSRLLLAPGEHGLAAPQLAYGSPRSPAKIDRTLGARYVESMRGNLADPDYEPTDEELSSFMRRAFADVGSRHERALKELHEQIAEERRLVLARLCEQSS